MSTMNKQRYFCSLCKQQCADWNNLKNHQCVFSLPSNSPAIDAVQQNANNQNNVNQSNHKQVLIKYCIYCNKCRQKFGNGTDYEVHFALEHLCTYNCAACEFKTVKKTDLLLHTKIKHKGKLNLFKYKIMLIYLVNRFNWRQQYTCSNVYRQ